MDERRVVQNAYDEMAADYAAEVSESSSDQPEPLRRFRDELDADDDLLDAGCGPGRGILEWAEGTAVGLDISREQLALAQTNVTAALVQGDMTALPFADNSFDAVVAMYSLIAVLTAGRRWRKTVVPRRTVAARRR